MENDGKDVGFIDDALMVIENMLAGQFHAESSYIETKNPDYLKLAREIRSQRSRLLSKLVKEEGQNYCLSKHCLFWAVGYRELSSRASEVGDEEYAKELLESAVFWENIFVELNKDGGSNGRKSNN